MRIIHRTSTVALAHYTENALGDYVRILEGDNVYVQFDRTGEFIPLSHGQALRVPFIFNEVTYYTATNAAAVRIFVGKGEFSDDTIQLVANDLTISVDGVISVDDNGGSLSVDDGGSSLTVDAPFASPITTLERGCLSVDRFAALAPDAVYYFQGAGGNNKGCHIHYHPYFGTGGRLEISRPNPTGFAHGMISLQQGETIFLPTADDVYILNKSTGNALVTGYVYERV